MAKYYGKIGFADNQETKPGIWTDVIVERTYYGDVLRNLRRSEYSGQINDDLNLNNLISIVADSFILKYFPAIVYIEWMGTLWKVSSVEIQRPRLILTIGGVYNGERPDGASDAP